jgi:response regulator NasT
MLRVLVVDQSRDRADVVRRALMEAGEDHVVEIATGSSDLLVLIRAAQPDIVIVDLDLPDRDTIEQLRVATKEMPRPIVMFVDQTDDAGMQAAIDAGVSAYVVDGLTAKRVKPVLDVAIARFHAFEQLRLELDLARLGLAERRIIDRAKGILMKTRGFTEEEAYAALRSKAMSEQRKIADIAQSVVSVAELFK